MPWTTYDISEITAALVAQLTTAVETSPLWTSEGGTIPNYLVNVSASSPDTMRNATAGECQLNLYLLHVGQDPFYRNTSIYGPSGMANNQQPLGLTLSYLLTAFAGENAEREQQALSIALAYFYENPIFTGPINPVSLEQPYLTVQLGTDTLTEMSALWQSFAVAYRLSTIYRVAVAFMTPSQPAGTPKPNPTKIGIAVAPAPASLALTPQLYGPLQRVAFTLPPPPDSNPDDVTMTTAPLALAGGVTVVLGGQGLAPNPALDILLTALDGTGTWKITGWQSAPATDSTMTLTPPTTYAIGAAPAPPASTPRPGLYLISVSDGATASPAVPVTIVPIFTNVTSPAILTLSGGAYKFTGAGFVPGATQLFAGGQQLDPAAVTISLAGDSVSFTLPATQPPGTFPLRVRVEGVDAPATWQVAA